MGYRKLEVNGKTYEFTVGRSHVKIRGGGFSKVMAKSEVGQPAEGDRYAVSPANIRNVVLGRPGPRVFFCADHDVATTSLAFDPYDAELEGRKRLMIDCAKCLDMSAWCI